MHTNLEVVEMTEGVELASALARRLARAFESAWRHVPRNCSARASRRCGIRAQHFSGGPSRLFGRVAVQPGCVPVAPKFSRTRDNVLWASCRLAFDGGSALSWAASDNRSIHTDAHVHRAAQRRLFVGAGDFQRYEGMAERMQVGNLSSSQCSHA